MEFWFILPAISILAIALIISLTGPEKYDLLGIGLLKSLIVHGVLIVILSECLSLSQAFNQNSVRLFWLIFAFVNTLLVLYLCKESARAIAGEYVQQLKQQHISFLEKAFILGVVSILGTTLIVALKAPPNNWDSMTYHMPRVMHWVQNASVHLFRTSILRQISLPPGNAYAIAQLQILSGGDYFANCVQWLAFLGSLIATMMLSQLVLPKPSRIWPSLILAASIPMGLMQASTTQSDLLTTFWLLCYVYFIFRTPSYSLIDIMWAALAFSLAIVTKPTALIFGLPFTLVLVFKLVREELSSRRGRLWVALTSLLGKIISFAVIAISLSIGYWSRNYSLFGSILGGDQGTRVIRPGALSLVSNLFKIFYINFPFDSVKKIVLAVHGLTGYKIYTQNSDFSESILNQSGLKFLSPHEDFVGAPVHILFFMLGMGLLSYAWFRRPSQRASITSLLLLSAVIIIAYGGFAYSLKWAPFHNRLLLPLVFLGVPLMSYAMQHLFTWRLQKWVLIGLLVMSMAYALTSLRRPLIPLPVISSQQLAEQSPSILTLSRQDVYFSGARKYLATPYNQAVSTIVQQGCRAIGLEIAGDDWEYPFWVLLSSQLGKSFKIQHVNTGEKMNTIINPSFPDEEICAVIAIGSSGLDDNKAQPSRYQLSPWGIWYRTELDVTSEVAPSRMLTVYGVTQN